MKSLATLAKELKINYVREVGSGHEGCFYRDE
jgi:hypothetical protein